MGSEIAEWLGIPSVANVREIREVTDEDLTIAMDLPEEIEIARVQMPCLLAVDKDIFMPRLPSYVRKKGGSRPEDPGAEPG